MDSQPTSKELELRPCPFCGRAARFEEVEAKAGGAICWSVGCELDEGRIEDQCIGWMSHQTYARKSDAAKAWNTRYSSAEPPVNDPAACSHAFARQCVKCHKTVDDVHADEPPDSHSHKLDDIVTKIMDTHDRAGVSAVVRPILRELDRAIQVVKDYDELVKQLRASPPPGAADIGAGIPPDGAPSMPTTTPPGAWRSCADDPPVEWLHVLLYRPGPNQTFFLGEWYRHNDGRVLWTLNGRTGYGVEPPSHWMLLPASPATKPAVRIYSGMPHMTGICENCGKVHRDHIVHDGKGNRDVCPALGEIDG